MHCLPTCLHDAEIVGLVLPSGLDERTKELVLTVHTDQGHRQRLQFHGTMDWALSPFGSQNIILNFYIYDHLTLTEHILDYFGVPEHWDAIIYSGTHRLYAFMASVGMAGVVLAQELSIDEEA